MYKWLKGCLNKKDIPFTTAVLMFCFFSGLFSSANVKQTPQNPNIQLFKLEDLRKQRLEDLATLIEKIYRGWKCRTRFLLMKKSQIVIAAWYRRYAVRHYHY